MLLIRSLPWLAAVAQSCIAAEHGLLYFSKQRQAPSTPATTISPQLTRLILSRRLGLSQYHTAGDLDEASIEALNRYGASGQRLFGPAPESAPKSHRLLIIEGVEDPEDLVNEVVQPSCKVESVPGSEATEQLSLDFQAQAKLFSALHAQKPASIVYDTSLKDLSTRSHDEAYKTGLSAARRSIKAFVTANGGEEFTLLITPPSSQTSKSSSAYGESYRPDAALAKRQHLNRPAEEVLSPVADAAATSNSTSSSVTKGRSSSSPGGASSSGKASPSSSSSSTSSSSAAHRASSSSSTPASSKAPPPPAKPTALPKGPLPICYASADLASSSTNNCSSHGSPMQRSPDCWVCKCGSTQLSTGNAAGKGKKTIYWSGAACQKKDVSMPFWLLGGFTVGLVATVAWAIATLFAVGQEPLPGVIAAGVVGPRAQK